MTDELAAEQAVVDEAYAALAAMRVDLDDDTGHEDDDAKR